MSSGFGPYQSNYQYYQPIYQPAPASHQVYYASAPAQVSYYPPPAPKTARRRPKKKGICVGINYLGTKNSLHGCIEDAKKVYDYLKIDCRFDEVYFRSDGPRETANNLPTKEVVLDDMKWLVADAQPGDVLFFFYAGHGTQVADKDGDEEDGMDEAIVTLPSSRNPRDDLITDDEINTIMTSRLPPGCSLFAVFDCCHSGSILDLPITYCSRSNVPRCEIIRDIDFSMEYKPHVVLLSGCRDEETSKEVSTGRGRSGGAMTTAFINFVVWKAQRHEPFSYLQLLYAVRAGVDGPHMRNDQSPQISSLHEIDLLGMCCFL